MTKPNQDLIDRLGAASLEAKEVIREGHVLLKDLKQTIKEARTINEGLLKELDASLREDVNARLRQVLEEIGDVQQRLYKRCLRAFDHLADSMGIGPKNAIFLEHANIELGLDIKTPTEGEG